MKLLVTAGNTQTPIDRVRCITNIFSGRTGAALATTAHADGHTVTLFTSHPDVLDTMPAARPRIAPNWRVEPYRTFEDLESLLAAAVPYGGFDAIVHAAAVNDYHVVGTFARDGAEFVDVTAGKVKSHHADLWIRLKPAPKLIDKFRRDWGYTGQLVKFKLEVGTTDAELLAIAEASRKQSRADLMVANTLEGMNDWAFVGADENYEKIPRSELSRRILERIGPQSTTSLSRTT